MYDSYGSYVPLVSNKAHRMSDKFILHYFISSYLSEIYMKKNENKMLLKLNHQLVQFGIKLMI